MRHAFYLSEPASQPASSTSNRRSTTLLTNPSSLLSIRMCTVCIVAGVHRIWTKVGCCCFYSFCQKISKIRVQLTLLVGYLISSRHKSISFQVGILAFVRRVTSNTLMTCVHKRNEKKNEMLEWRWPAHAHISATHAIKSCPCHVDHRHILLHCISNQQ